VTTSSSESTLTAFAKPRPKSHIVSESKPRKTGTQPPIHSAIVPQNMRDSRAHARTHARGEVMTVTNSHDWEWVKLADPAHRGFHLCKRCGVRVIGGIEGLIVGCI